MTFSQLIRIHRQDIAADQRRAASHASDTRQKNRPKPVVFTDWASL